MEPVKALSFYSTTNWVGSYLDLFHTWGYRIHGAVANTSDPLSKLLRSAFGNVSLFSEYSGHEEDTMSNSTDIPIAYWSFSSTCSAKFSCNYNLAIYRHYYGNGTVIDAGIFGTDILGTDGAFQFFVMESIIN